MATNAVQQQIPSSTGSFVLIEQVFPTTPGGKPMRVLLVGPSLPIKGGASWEGDTRIKTTWFPGNGVEASQQNLGPQENPSEFNGTWKRTLMGRTPAVFTDGTGTSQNVVDPLDLWEYLEMIRLAGALVRVTWQVSGKRFVGLTSGFNTGTIESVDKKIVRVGRIKSIKITPDTETDVKWSMNFEWVSRGGTQQKATEARRGSDIASTADAVESAIAALDGLIADRVTSIRGDVRMSANNLTLGQLEKMANAPQEMLDDIARQIRFNVNQFERAKAIAKKFAGLPESFQKGVQDLATSTALSARTFVKRDGQTPVERKSTSRKVSDLGRAHVRYARISQQMTAIARASAEVLARIREAKVSGANQGVVSVQDSATTRAGDLIAIRVAKAGDTPASLSTKYYGTPDQAEFILRANRLPSFTPAFRVGQIVVIPALANAPKKR